MAHEAPTEVSLQPAEGWHCSHLFYAIDRGRLSSFRTNEVVAGRDEIVMILDSSSPNAPRRMQTSWVAGHKADVGLMLLDPDPQKIDAVHQRLLASTLGPAI